MANFYPEDIGEFGVPGHAIEQTLNNKYDPYSGIDLRDDKVENNICIDIQGMRPPEGTPRLNGNGEYQFAEPYLDGIFRSLTFGQTIQLIDNGSFEGSSGGISVPNWYNDSVYVGNREVTPIYSFDQGRAYFYETNYYFSGLQYSPLFQDLTGKIQANTTYKLTFELWNEDAFSGNTQNNLLSPRLFITLGNEEFGLRHEVVGGDVPTDPDDDHTIEKIFTLDSTHLQSNPWSSRMGLFFYSGNAIDGGTITSGCFGGYIKNVSLTIMEDDGGTLEDEEITCDTDLSDYNLMNVFEARAVCVDGSTVLMGNSYDDEIISNTDWFYNNGKEACIYNMKENSSLYFEADNDKRQALGLFNPIDINVSNNDFTENIPDPLFEQTPKANLLNNGDGKLVRENTYKTSTLGSDSYKPLGGWTYLGLDGVGIHLTTYETFPGPETPKKWIQSEEYSQESNSIYGYAGWAPYIYPFEELESPNNHYETFFPNSRPINYDYKWAKWVRDEENCFSHGKCLKFDSTGLDEWGGYYSDPDLNLAGLLDYLIEKNEYRTINQAQNIYDSFSQSDQDGDIVLNPYSSLEVSFKMKTTAAADDDLNNAYVETSILKEINLNKPTFGDFSTEEDIAGRAAQEALSELGQNEETLIVPSWTTKILAIDDYATDELFDLDGRAALPSAQFALTGQYGNQNDNWSGWYLNKVYLKSIKLAGGFYDDDDRVESILIGGDYLQYYSDGAQDEYGNYNNTDDNPELNKLNLNYKFNPVTNDAEGYTNQQREYAEDNYNNESAALLVWTSNAAHQPNGLVPSENHNIFMNFDYTDTDRFGTEASQVDEMGYGISHNWYDPYDVDAPETWEYNMPTKIKLDASGYASRGIGMWVEVELEYSSNRYEQLNYLDMLLGSISYTATYGLEDRDGYNCVYYNIYTSTNSDEDVAIANAEQECIDSGIAGNASDTEDPNDYDNRLCQCVFMGVEQTGQETDFGTHFYETNYGVPTAAYNSIHSNGSEGDKVFGSTNRFKNTELNKWEEFKYTFNLIDLHNLEDDNLNIRDLNFIIQSSSDEENNGFKSSTVYIDDMEVKESYKFTPDVDTRKKKGPNEYGIGDLTKYYDPTIPNQLEAYNDTTAPLEVQFYFYPRYNMEGTFDKKPIIYNDFREGMFYLYDVDWGDESPKDFTSKPELLGENISVYHTYKTSGIFEITGTMIRMKPNKDYDPIGIIHNEKFKLFINVNEGLDEDFYYFGTEGSSFIPYKNTLPVVGGFGKNSLYYKSIKRQLGILENGLDIKTDFKSLGDRLKTEIALDKMDSSYSYNFDVLKEYQKERFIEIESTDEIQSFETFYADENKVQLPFDGVGEQLHNSPYFATLPFPRYVEEFDVDNLGDDFFNDNQNDLQFGTWASIHYRHDIALMLMFLSYGMSIGQSGIESDSSWGYVYPDYARSWNSLSDIPTFSTFSTESEIIYNGIQTNSEELGKTIGDADITNIRYFDKPKQMYEMLGYETFIEPVIPTPEYNPGVMPVPTLEDGSDIWEYYGNLTLQYHLQTVYTALVTGGNGNNGKGEPFSTTISGLYDHHTDCDSFTTCNALMDVMDLSQWYRLKFTYMGTEDYYSDGNEDPIGAVSINLRMGDSGHPGTHHRIHADDWDRQSGPDGAPPSPYWGTQISFVSQATSDGVKLGILNSSGNEESDFFEKANCVAADHDNPYDYSKECTVWVLLMPTDDGVTPTKHTITFHNGRNNNRTRWNRISLDRADLLPLEEVAPLDEVGNPAAPNYWKNIIPKDYSIFNRGGIAQDGDGNYFLNDFSNQQNWLDNYYYPVLPRYGSNGKFISDEYPDGKQPFPLNGPITDENYYDNNLKISITADTIDTNVFNDKSGNNNYGFNFSDYKPQFNQKTLKPQKVKFIGNKNSSKFGGPF